jgi:Cellulase (glycosyl hydrolase family 5)
MNRGWQILLVLLGCGVIAAIAALIDWRDAEPGYNSHSGWSMGFALEALGKERPVGQAPLVRPLTSQEATIVVGTNGAILKDGKAWRGIGINYFSAFNRLIESGDDASSFSGLAVLAEHKIPFIRFAGCGFWPNEWSLYLTNKAEYFRRMDRFVAEAHKRNIGLIPSLFWYDGCIPDVVGEPRNQWGNPRSKTIAFMRQYVSEVVGRYLHERTIWAWELGNEYSLGADLPNAAEHRPPVDHDLGTAAARSAEDDLIHEMVAAACAEFGRAVRALDSTRPITTGHSLPRRAAEHLRREKSWMQDSPEEFERNLLEVTPSPCDLISVHLYPFDKERFNAKDTPYAQTMRYCMEAARRGGKALFVGEFGAPDSQKDGGPEAARKNILEMIAALESTGVPLAALWNFDLAGQDGSLNVAADDPRSWVLDELQHANERLQRQH